MRTLKHLFIVLSAAVVLFTSCNTTVKADGGGNLTNWIPDNALFVAGFNGKQLVEKGGLNKFKEFNIYNLMKGEAFNQDEKLATMLDEFLSDTRTSGLNLDHAYVYGVKGVNNFNVVILTKMHNMKKFEAKLKEMMDGAGEEPKDHKDYKQLSLGSEADILWNKDRLYIVTGNYNWDTEDPTDYGYLFIESKSNITNNADFAKFADENNDVSFWASYDQLFGMISQGSGLDAETFKKMFVFDISGLNIHALTDFKNGEAVAKMYMTPKSKVDAMMSQFPILKKDFDSNLLKYFPEKSYTVLKVSFNVQEYVRMMKDQMAKVSELMKEMTGGDDEDGYAYDPMEEVSAIFENPLFKTLSAGIVGDMVFSIYDFQQGAMPLPMASLILSVNNKETFETLISLIPSDYLKKQDKYYAIMAGPMAFGYIAFNDNKIFASTDEKAILAFLDKGYEENLTNSIHAKSLKEDFFFWNVNLDLASYPEHITMALRSAMGREYAIFNSFINIYKSIEYKATKDYELELNLKMQSDSNNSLKVILKNIDENVPSLMGM